MLGPIVMCFTIFDGYAEEACFFNGNIGGGKPGERSSKGGTGRSEEKGNCG